MAVHKRLYGTRGRPAPFAETLRVALASAEIAEPARALGISAERLAAIVSESQADAFAEPAREAWRKTWGELQRAEQSLRMARARQRSHRLRRRLRPDLRLQHVWTEQVDKLSVEVRRLDAMEAALRRTYVDTLYEQGILRRLRAFLDERGDRTWSTTLALSADDAPGLAELRSGPWVPLTAIERVGDLLRRMPGGSIGISGPRGVGKTTLIRWFTSARSAQPGIGVYVSAPTQYDAREFLLHLFATLCSTVIGATEQTGPRRSETRPATAWLHPQTLGVGLMAASSGLVVASLLHAHVDARLLAGAACAGVAAVAVLACVVLLLTSRGPQRSELVRFAGAAALGTSVVAVGLVALSQRSPSTPWWAWGAIGAIAAVVLMLWPSGSAGELPGGVGRSHAATLHRRARAELEGIRFQMTLSSGWSGAAKLPFAEGSVSGERSLASRPMSLPEVTAAMENFIRDASAVAPIVIGIDELDKIGSEEGAHRFLNEIKGIFGIPDCFFLVSVSEEAMSNFARRDARLRDAFDSSFDEIVHLRALTLDQSRAVLSERVIGLPVQFAALCHVLSGGLPRDLIRSARLVLSLNPGEAQLDTVVRALLVFELEVRARAAGIRIRSMRSHAAALPVLGWLAEVERAVDALDAACAEDDMWQTLDGADAQERAELTELMLELEGFCYFALTLRETFDETLDRSRFEELQRGAEAGTLDALARARATFSVNALLAWREVSAFRDATGLMPIAPPQPWRERGARPRRPA